VSSGLFPEKCLGAPSLKTVPVCPLS